MSKKEYFKKKYKTAEALLAQASEEEIMDVFLEINNQIPPQVDESKLPPIAKKDIFKNKTGSYSSARVISRIIDYDEDELDVLAR